MVMDDSGTDRAQLLLVGAFAIGITIVGTVVLLNGMKYTDTIGSDGNGQALDEATRIEGIVIDDLTNLSEQVRRDVQTSERGLLGYEEAMRRNVSTYTRYYSQVNFDSQVSYINVSLNPGRSANGRLIRQQTTGDFRRGGNEWDAARDATIVSPANFTVDDFACSNGRDSYLAFSVNNSDNPDADFWEARIGTERTSGPSCTPAPASSPSDSNRIRYVQIWTEDGLQRVIEEDDVGAFSSDPSTSVDFALHSGEIEGTEVFADDTFETSVERPWDVTIKNTNSGPPPGRTANGRYWVATDSTYLSTSNPDVDPIMSVPAVDIVYAQPELNYTTTTLLGERGSGGFVIPGWVRYDDDLVFAHDDTPGAQTVHETNWEVGSSNVGNSLDEIGYRYDDPVDLSDVQIDEDVRAYVDTDGDSDLEADVTNDIDPGNSDVDNGADQLNITFDGSHPRTNNIASTDHTYIIAVRDVRNPTTPVATDVYIGIPAGSDSEDGEIQD